MVGTEKCRLKERRPDMNKKNAHFVRSLIPVLSCTFLLSFQPNAYAKTGEEIAKKPDTDISQTLYVDEDELMETEEKKCPCCSLFCIGDDFCSKSGAGNAECDVRNKPESTHDIRMSWYITEEELKLHSLNTEGPDGSTEDKGGKWAIARTGLFEPGYRITEVDLLTLPDGSELPKGEYSQTNQ